MQMSSRICKYNHCDCVRGVVSIGVPLETVQWDDNISSSIRKDAMVDDLCTVSTCGNYQFYTVQIYIVNTYIIHKSVLVSYGRLQCCSRGWIKWKANCELGASHRYVHLIIFFSFCIFGESVIWWRWTNASILVKWSLIECFWVAIKQSRSQRHKTTTITTTTTTTKTMVRKKCLITIQCQQFSDNSDRWENVEMNFSPKNAILCRIIEEWYADHIVLPMRT